MSERLYELQTSLKRDIRFFSDWFARAYQQIAEAVWLSDRQKWIESGDPYTCWINWSRRHNIDLNTVPLDEAIQLGLRDDPGNPIVPEAAKQWQRYRDLVFSHNRKHFLDQTHGTDFKDRFFGAIRMPHMFSVDFWEKMPPGVKLHDRMAIFDPGSSKKMDVYAISQEKIKEYEETHRVEGKWHTAEEVRAYTERELLSRGEDIILRSQRDVERELADDILHEYRRWYTEAYVNIKKIEEDNCVHLSHETAFNRVQNQTMEKFRVAMVNVINNAHTLEMVRAHLNVYSERVGALEEKDQDDQLLNTEYTDQQKRQAVELNAHLASVEWSLLALQNCRALAQLYQRLRDYYLPRVEKVDPEWASMFSMMLDQRIAENEFTLSTLSQVHHKSEDDARETHQLVQEWRKPRQNRAFMRDMAVVQRGLVTEVLRYVNEHYEDSGQWRGEAIHFIDELCDRPRQRGTHCEREHKREVALQRRFKEGVKETHDEAQGIARNMLSGAATIEVEVKKFRARAPPVVAPFAAAHGHSTPWYEVKEKVSNDSHHAYMRHVAPVTNLWERLIRNDQTLLRAHKRVSDRLLEVFHHNQPRKLQVYWEMLNDYWEIMTCVCHVRAEAARQSQSQPPLQSAKRPKKH